MCVGQAGQLGWVRVAVGVCFRGSIAGSGRQGRVVWAGVHTHTHTHTHANGGGHTMGEATCDILRSLYPSGVQSGGVHTIFGHTIFGHTIFGHTIFGHTIFGHTIFGHTILDEATCDLYGDDQTFHEDRIR